jgi:hypothetical protein
MRYDVRECRFCRKRAHTDYLVKYGTRHYAHPSCYLRSEKLVSDLPQYEQRYFDSKLHDEIRDKM